MLQPYDGAALLAYLHYEYAVQVLRWNDDGRVGACGAGDSGAAHDVAGGVKKKNNMKLEEKLYQ